MKLSQKLIEKFELDEFYENFPAIILSLKIHADNSQECSFISENCYKYLGFSSEDLIKNWQIFSNRIPALEYESFLNNIQEAIKQQNRLEFIFRFQTKNFTTKWIKITANIVHKYGFHELQGIITDVTNEKLSELKENKFNNALIFISRNPIIFEGKIDEIGEFCTKLISETMDVSRSSLWLYNEKNKTITCNKIYFSNTNSFDQGASFKEEEQPEYFNSILNKPYIIANDAREHNDTKNFTESYFIPNNIYSLLDIPIFHNGKILGVLCQEQCQKIRNWQKNEINFLFQLGEYISYCFAVNEKKIFEKQLADLNHNLQKMVEDKTRQLTAKSIELEIKTKEIIDSIQYAKKIQNSILPEIEDLKNYLPNHFILYKPKDIVAGDFYWLHKTNNTTLFAICDCTGHGIPGAFISILAYKFLRKIVSEGNSNDPNYILKKLNNLFIDHFNKKNIETIEGIEIGLISIENKIDNSCFVKYSGANISLYLAQKSNSINIEKFTHNKKTLGFCEYNTEFIQHQFNVNKGDSVYLFTDGCYDQFGGDRGKKIKRKNLVRLIQNISTLKIEDQKKELETFLESWQGKLEQLDDMCLIGIQF